MTDLVLGGCRTTPLAGYLQALGLLRAVARCLDGRATGRWEHGRFVLGCSMSTVEELVDALVAQFEPEAVVSPWNGGSGFAGNGKNPAAERAVQAVRESGDPRLGRLRRAVVAADSVVATARSLGWGGRGEELWDKARKAEVLQLCRNEFPDDALAWVDAAVALGQNDEPAFSRLLGTGGNFGRLDLSSTYLKRADAALTDRRSPDWLRAALTGDESVPYLRDSVGQFDPGRAGGIQSSPLEKADDNGFVNPWSFLLVVEGTLPFASAVVRRHGALSTRAALPFQVQGSTAGFASGAPDEDVLGELWAPEWSRPARIEEIVHLLGEGRAEWRGRPAQSGLDFVRAVASLGVDRGLDAFTRHVFLNRHGQNPLAVPAGRVGVVRRRGVELLTGLDGWRGRLPRAALPAGAQVLSRALDTALFDLARQGPEGLPGVFAALGRLHEAVARSGTLRKRTSPLILPEGPALAELLREQAAHDLDLRLALGFATAGDGGDGPPTLGGLRPLLSAIVAEGRRVAWAPRVAAAGLAEAARRRSFPDTPKAPAGDDEPSIRGVRIAYRYGFRIAAADLLAFIGREHDERRFAGLLSGLLTVDWPQMDRASLSSDRTTSPEPSLDLLLPFAGANPLSIMLADGEPPATCVLRPASWWPASLVAGDVDRVLDDAAHRLRVAGVRFVIQPASSIVDGAQLAALLLLPVADHQRRTALRRVAVLPRPHTEEITP